MAAARKKAPIRLACSARDDCRGVLVFDAVWRRDEYPTRALRVERSTFNGSGRKTTKCA